MLRTLMLNGAETTWSADSISYEDIAGLVGMKHPTIIVRRARMTGICPPDGSYSMVPKQVVRVTENMEITAVTTVGA